VVRKSRSTKAADKDSKALQDSPAGGPDYPAYVIATAMIYITIYMYPRTNSDMMDESGKATVGYVFFYGWLTAIFTGLGVLPFFFVSEPNDFWRGASNAIAVGMMSAASYSLAYEGAMLNEDVLGWGAFAPRAMLAAAVGTPLHAITGTTYDFAVLDTSLARTICGILLGVAFIVITGKVLASREEELSIGNIVGASATKMVLIIFVMTLHSLTEGIGIGVSFGGKSLQLGQFISTSLAVHNIPEGLAVALVLFPMRISKLRAVLWAIFTSLPQPIMAVPSFIFVKQFMPLLPVGLGFASGAMAYVSAFELFPDALEGVKNLPQALIISALACAVMLFVQDCVHDSI
jgi:zinc transporter ZupT